MGVNGLQVGMEATMTGYFSGDTAVDDVQMTSGNCQGGFYGALLMLDLQQNISQLLTLLCVCISAPAPGLCLTSFYF